MKKMPCVFVRTFHAKHAFTLTDEVATGCQWVLDGEGVASRKRDGTACLVQEGKLHKRYDARKDRKTGEFKPPPPGALPCGDPDPETGHWPHWVPVDAANPADKWHHAAWSRLVAPLGDGTYELCGPHFSGNAEAFADDTFVRHGTELVTIVKDDLAFERLRALLTSMRAEGIVFTHPDGRRAKLRRKDYGLPWPIPGDAGENG